MTEKKTRAKDKTPPYFMTEHSLMMCNAYKTLSLVAREALRSIMVHHTGSNNGAIGMGAQQVADACGIADLKTARQALVDLETKGFIVETFRPKQGQKLVKRWGLTCYPIADADTPLRTYLTWAPGRKFTRPPSVPFYDPISEEFIYIQSGDRPAKRVGHVAKARRSPSTNPLDDFRLDQSVRVAASGGDDLRF